MTRYITVIAFGKWEKESHIWKRKEGNGLWRSLCGKLSDDWSMRVTDEGITCSLCARIQRVEAEVAKRKARHELHKFL